MANKTERATGMNKSDIIQLLSKDIDIPLRKTEEIVDKFFETMSNALLSLDRIEIRGFGSFEVREYAGYTGRNPKTGEEIVVLPKKLPFFKPGKDFKEKVNLKQEVKKPRKRNQLDR
jgi:integration host factor subunit beta